MQKVLEPEHLEYSTLSKVRERLKAQGLVPPVKPAVDIPEIPKDLATRGGDEVVELYRLCASWHEYVSHAHAIASLMAKEWKNNLTLLVKSQKKAGRDADDIELDPTIIAAKRSMQIAEQEAELWGVQKSVLDRRMKLVSRTVEVLKLDAESSRRSGNVGTPWPFPRTGSRDNG